MDTEPEQHTSGEPTPMTRAEVMELLNTLRYGSRAVAAAVYLGGMSVQEVAAESGVTVSAIHYRIRQVTKALGIAGSKSSEWRAWLQTFGDLLGPCLRPSGEVPCPRIDGAPPCATCDALGAANRAIMQEMWRDRPDKPLG